MGLSIDLVYDVTSMKSSECIKIVKKISTYPFPYFDLLYSEKLQR